MSDISLPARFQAALTAEQAGNYDQAETLYRALLAEFPGVVGAMDRLGALALARGEVEDGLSWFQAALGVQPDFGPAAVNAAVALQHLGRWDEAVAVLTRAASLSPRFAALHFMLSQLYWERGLYDTACDHLGRAMTLAPEFNLENYETTYLRLSECDWRGYEAIKALMTRRIRAGSVITVPLTFMYYSDSIADQAQCARHYTAGHYPPRRAVWQGEPRREGRIRVGYLSAEFHNHAVARLMAGVFENHDHKDFEFFAYSLLPPVDHDMRQRIAPTFDHFRELSELSDEAAAALIRQDDIDILVGLSGYTLNARPDIMARRPAPLQVSLLGYPGTLGAPYVDYLIADRDVVHYEDMRHYSEKIVWMPDVYQPTDDKVQVGESVPTRAELGLPEKGVVFSGYNPLRKISPTMFSVWMRILDQVPGSVLWLQDGGETARENLRREAKDRGVDPDRLVFAPFVERHEDHLARQKQADLYLDTLPYNAHSIASDAMWAGLPVITCAGSTFPGRVCAGLVKAAGFPELAVDDLAAYEALAVSLGRDPERLAALRRRMETEARKSPLFDTPLYTRHLEAAYRTMFERAQTRRPPEYFEVRPLPRA